jgi:hypothetical protein
MALAVAIFGIMIDWRPVELAAGALLIGWAIYHAVYGHRHRVRVGMQTGLSGLALWSFLMATVHGAGLMLIPVLIPLCMAASPARVITASGSLSLSLAAVGVHTLAMLLVTGLIAIIVYKWFGLAFLRHAWINLDMLWVVALTGVGFYLLF